MEEIRALLRTGQNLIRCVVEFLVALPALKIVIPLFDHSHSEHENKRSDVSEEETDLEEWYELTQRYQQEEHVEEESEFVVEHLG